MQTSTDLHAKLIDYCERNGIAATSFGALLFGNPRFAVRLERGTAAIRSGELAQRFMAENPDIPRREFGAVAKAWRQRIDTEGGGGAGGDGAGHDGAPAAVASGNEACTAATLEQVSTPHNREFQAAGGGA